MATKPKFTNLIQLTQYFSDEANCSTYLEQLRWNGAPACPYCNHTKIYRFGNGKIFKCAKCRKKFSATVGTIFENTKISLQKWFVAIYIASSHKKGVSSLQLAKDLGVTQKTAWFMLHRIREMLTTNNPLLLCNHVEVDETFIGGRATNKHKKVRDELKKAGTGYIHKVPVLGFLQRGGNVQTYIPTGVSGLILKPIIRENIQPGSILMTDGFGAYSGLNKDYQHEVINHEKDEYVRGEFHTNSIEGFWSQLKRGIYGIYHQVSPKHLHRYCNEFAYRYNTRRQTEVERFDHAIRQSGKRLKYQNLIK